MIMHTLIKNPGRDLKEQKEATVKGDIISSVYV